MNSQTNCNHNPYRIKRSIEINDTDANKRIKTDAITIIKSVKNPKFISATMSILNEPLNIKKKSDLIKTEPDQIIQNTNFDIDSNKNLPKKILPKIIHSAATSKDNSKLSAPTFSSKLVCPHCHLTNHCRISSLECLKNPKNPNFKIYEANVWQEPQEKHLQESLKNQLYTNCNKDKNQKNNKYSKFQSIQASNKNDSDSSLNNNQQNLLFTREKKTCQHCHLDNHLRISSIECLKNPKNPNYKKLGTEIFIDKVDENNNLNSLIKINGSDSLKTQKIRDYFPPDTDKTVGTDITKLFSINSNAISESSTIIIDLKKPKTFMDLSPYEKEDSSNLHVDSLLTIRQI